MTTMDLAERGRDAYARQAWGDAYTCLAKADRESPLHAPDLEALAFAAYLTGRREAAIEHLERTHRALLDDGEVAGAVRCTFWLGMTLLERGEVARAGGWFARGQRLLDEADLDGPERGYMLIPPAVQAAMGGDPDTSLALCRQIAAIADRFNDPDLVTFSRLGQGQALIDKGDAARGIALLDEAMVGVAAGEVAPTTAGIVYCAVIIACRKVFDLGRAKEWTAALTRWCDTQQDLQPYRGQCLVHRSEILQLQGDWQGAMQEVEQACTHLSRNAGDPVMGMAQYQLAELHRLRGAFRQAEPCYEQANQWGHTVHPGLALLRLAQGRIADAEAAIRRVIEEEQDPVGRSRVLAAYVEIMLALGDVAAAAAGVEELGAIAKDFGSPYLQAVSAYARAAWQLAEDDATSSCAHLREAAAGWRELDAPYEVGRTHLLMSQALQRLGDHDTARMELSAARRIFEQLDAAPLLAEVDRLLGRVDQAAPGGLTPREVEVIVLAARGRTNRQIAEELVISEKTVARHMSNIFTKLGISSRAAATAYAYEHDLVKP